MSNFKEIKKLETKTRNQVRAILSSDGDDGIVVLNKIRDRCGEKEICQVERVLRFDSMGYKAVVPKLFPVKPQTKENYRRLCRLGLRKQAKMILHTMEDNKDKVRDLVCLLADLNVLICEERTADADELLRNIFYQHGYSHLILRKAALLNSMDGEGDKREDEKPFSEFFLNECGLGKSNVIVNSVVQCYQEGQDFLGMKRSIMNMQDRGDGNKYTRDMARLSFHPFAKDEEDLRDLIQSCFQSSLIDALLVIYINRDVATESLGGEGLSKIVAIFDGCSCIEKIAGLYSFDDESVFYKRSSAWLEDKGVCDYRFFVDHFFDDPESDYFDLEKALPEAKKWVGATCLSDLPEADRVTVHDYAKLGELESKGLVTKTAIFNFIIYECRGGRLVDEDVLIEVMGVTRDLVKTIDVVYLKNLALNQDSKISRIILYLLIAKKSKSEVDDFSLRRLMQGIIKEKHDRSLVNFVSFLHERSPAVAEYTYQVCTEDFIAKLSHIISSSSDITETRAALHKWMGDVTGEKSYKDRARLLLIDHQINKIRNEIDDNRIYVDVARFHEWINDEVIHDLGIALASMDYTNSLENGDSTQILQVIEKCYVSFCSNNIFGIASYLGRRIRHGTFKGHLSSGVIALEEDYKDVLNDPALFSKWNHWRNLFEERIHKIIRDKLHVNSQQKRDGLLKPDIKGLSKMSVAVACSNALTKDYMEFKSTRNSAEILTEYCWRMAEVDLSSVNSYLKSQKTQLVNLDVLKEIKDLGKGGEDRARDFCRDVQRVVTDKLQTMYGWFKRPLSVSPKASLSLLYKAVVAEVKDTFQGFEADTDFDEDSDVELVGGPYHVLYDAFYVVIYNAAKHGKLDGMLERYFDLVKNEKGMYSAVKVTIKSEIKDSDSEDLIRERLSLGPDDDVDNAQITEDRSGVRKLFHLQKADKNFNIEQIGCVDRKVVIAVSYALEH